MDGRVGAAALVDQKSLKCQLPTTLHLALLVLNEANGWGWGLGRGHTTVR